MTEINTPTSQQIDANLSATYRRIASLRGKMPDLSLSAVAGDREAIASLANIQAQIQQAEADLTVLDLAKSAALANETTATAEKTQASRAQHLAIAQDRAAEIVRLSGRTDELLAEFKTVLADLAVTEREIWNALREAAALPSDGVVGRKNLQQFAIEALIAFSNGTDRFRQARSVADIAAVAWADLLNDEGQADV